MARAAAAATAGLLLLAVSGLRADEKEKVDETLLAQRKAVPENWEKVGAGPSATHETEHLIVVAPKMMEKRLKDIGILLEKHYDTAHKALYQPRELLWPGKLTVYLFAQPDHLDAFIRRVEKRRVLGAEKGSYSIDDKLLHVAATVPREKDDPPVEVQAGQQIASAVLSRKAGVRTIVPSWLVNGFGRATYYRVAGPVHPAVSKDRKTAYRLAYKNKRKASDVWASSLEGEESHLLSASVADFLAYGPGKAKFAALVEGFRPEENVESKTVAQALEAAKLMGDVIDKNWKTWIVNPR
jgi:hypothetical protein